MREMSSAMTISASRVSSLIDMDDDESITKMLRKENPLYDYEGIIPPFVRFLPNSRWPRMRKQGTGIVFRRFSSNFDSVSEDRNCHIELL